MLESKAELPMLSERRKALFEPLEPINGQRLSAESLLPPPDFDSANYPRGWLIGKKRKLVNVDVVESMRRIAVQEMNRKVLFPELLNYRFAKLRRYDIQLKLVWLIFVGQRNQWAKRAVGRGFTVPRTPTTPASARAEQTNRGGEGKCDAARSDQHAYEHVARKR